ncbi:hypothetical protein RchiOBHm_Chr7g0237471 [Rosa chinensis]|uniref:Uncharacterized protein n=1 Tax=Rosa chinensis TaxID=74649 RepID=A0A2P6PH76_ROSCH|nr:hypothetical protein RchiOBHm_Chr7g0237471 [Rosa chinensis]
MRYVLFHLVTTSNGTLAFALHCSKTANSLNLSRRLDELLTYLAQFHIAAIPSCNSFRPSLTIKFIMWHAHLKCKNSPSNIKVL